MTDSNPSSSSDPSETMEPEFGSVAWVAEQLSNPFFVDMDLNDQAWATAEGRRVTEVINNLENGIVSQKDKEIDQLKTQLERKNAEVYHLANKVVNLKRFLVLESKEFGNFLGNLAEMGRKDVSSSGPVLNVGPFKDGNEVDEFQRMLNELSVKMKNGVAKGNQEFLSKINNMLLKSKGLGTPNPTTSATSTTTSFTNDSQTFTIPGFGTSSTNQVTAFILTPGMPNRGVPAYRQAGYNSSKGFTRLENGAGELGLINSSVMNAKHGVDLTKLDKGNFCMCGVKFNSAESLGQHLIVPSEQ